MSSLPLIDYIERKPKPLPDAQFDGQSYEYKYDHSRLRGQLLAVFQLMRDATWRTLGEIASITGQPEQSISARLRDCRKEKFGRHIVERRPRGDRSRGLFEYRVLVRGP